MNAVQQTVLVVEDELLIRWALADALEEAGYVVLEAANVLEAIAHLGRCEEIDALVTDVDMPGALDGLDLARMVSECAPRIGIVISSGRSRPVDDSVPPGARLVPKPCMPEVIVASIAALISDRAMRCAGKSTVRSA